jgi:hypothetical protein
MIILAEGNEKPIPLSSGAIAGLVGTRPVQMEIAKAFKNLKIAQTQ